jgi:hypothetical protein
MGCVVFVVVLLWGGSLLEACHQSSNTVRPSGCPRNREIPDSRIQGEVRVGSRSQLGLVVRSCHPGVLGSIPNERNQGEQGATLC